MENFQQARKDASVILTRREWRNLKILSSTMQQIWEIEEKQALVDTLQVELYLVKRKSPAQKSCDKT
jgi:hypothetical protein